MLVLNAALCLKLTRAHPLVRTTFTAAELYLLIENHSGYSLPFFLCNAAPFGLVTGAREHALHHQLGTVHFAAHFAHFDWLLARFLARGKRSTSSDCKVA